MKNGGKQSNDNQTRGPRIGSISPEQRKNAVDSDAHVVFDFTGLHKPAVSDLALVLTARLQTPPSESVWARLRYTHTHTHARHFGSSGPRVAAANKALGCLEK